MVRFADRHKPVISRQGAISYHPLPQSQHILQRMIIRNILFSYRKPNPYFSFLTKNIL